MLQVIVVADDLTGAVDAAARFRPAGDVVVVFDLHDLPRVVADVIAIDTNSRDTDAQTAKDAAVHACAAVLDLNAVVFKKMDSRLRGWFADEIVTMLAAGPWGCALVAPALPEQGRGIEGGRLRDRGVFGPSLWSAFHDASAAECGHVGREAIRGGAGHLREALSAGLRGGARVLLCDAESVEDLDALVRAGSEVQERRHWLWCGSAGLAGALARDMGAAAPPGASRVALPFLGLIGSPDPVARAQLCAAERCGLPVITLLRTDDGVLDATILDVATSHLGRDRGLFLTLPPVGAGTMPIVQAGQGLVRCALVLVTEEGPSSLILSGGGTARQICDALGIWGLRVNGEIAPGVPISKVLGPPALDGLQIVTKAGSFGGVDLWCQVIPCERGEGSGVRRGRKHRCPLNAPYWP